MAATQLANVVRHLHQIVRPPDGPERSDAQLLQCFLGSRDESSFRLLVERHGGMVLSVCRHVLRQRQDAEDAFQATFLVLARNAGSIRKGTALASWLYGVAYRTALKLRTRTSRRQRHETRAGARSGDRAPAREQAGPDLELALRELQAVLAEEVNCLPEKLRAPFVLCCLEGKSRPEAARQLGWKEGTVFGRVAEARKRLQQRLTRRGLTLASALCALAIESSSSAAVPPLLMRSTLKGALGIAAGQAAAGLVEAPVAALVEGVSQTVFLNKVKLASALLLVAGLLAGGVGVQIHRASATAPVAEQPTARAAPKADKPAAEKVGEITVNGRVVDADGQPIAGARLFMPGAYKGPIMKNDPPLVQETSGANGAFRFTINRSQLVPGRWLHVSADGFGLDAVEAEKLAKGEVTVRLAKDNPIAGRMLDLEGRPIKDVSVTIRRVQASGEGDLTPVLKSIHHDGNRVFTHPLRDVHLGTESGVVTSVKTDEAGRFRFTGLGKERLVVLWVEGPTIEHQVLYVLTRPGLNVKELVQSAPDRIGIGKSRLPLPAIYGPTFDHTAGPTKPITGVVRDRATGNPVAGVFVNGSARG
jgi:RNA polymerase sigma factor (sigma-70 family)